VAQDAGKLLPHLDAERPNDPVRLSIEDLTIQIKGRDREDFLWEIGSGANWLSYHVAVSLALQQFFVGPAHSPVPSFVVYDQPSQVYFPRSVKRDAQTGDPILRDEDSEAVKRTFKVMADVVKGAEGKLQIIVLDHADEAVWGKIPGVKKVDEWRDGQKLVPETWPKIR
jgi:hypothetical protein